MSSTGTMKTEPLASRTRRLAQRCATWCASATFVVALSFTVTPDVQANPRYASIVVDAYTGEVLSSDRADKQLYPASLTKIMTLFMVFEALERKEIKLTDPLPVSRRAAGMPPSKLHLRQGSTIKVEDAIMALVTKSANDVAVVVAEALGGTEIQFARKMTDRARQLGMSRTTFRNASGLPNRYQKSTARDMATLGRVLISRFPDYYTYFGSRRFSHNGRTYRNHNKLLGSYNGTDGIKTGYINASGFNLVASAQRDGRRIIGVVYGGRTSARRNNHMVNLLDRGFAEARRRGLVLAGLPPVPKRRPGAEAPDLIAMADARVLQVARMAKPSFATPATITLAENTAATAQQPDLAPEDMLNLPAIPGQKPDQESATNAQPRLVVAGLGAIPPGPTTGEQAAGQGDQSPNDRINAFEAPDDNLSSLARLNTQPTALTNLLGAWSIQVGAFRTEDRTAAAIEAAVELAPELLSWAEPLVKPIVTGRGTLYRARLAGLDEDTARTACLALERRGMGCLPVQNATVR
ncbi:MAG: D-alanyl-D-alanine carboxypeptidase family protein [Pseudomonadota bacterium]